VCVGGGAYGGMGGCARAHGCEGVMEREWHEEETEEETDAKTETREEGTRRALWVCRREKVTVRQRQSRSKRAITPAGGWGAWGVTGSTRGPVQLYDQYRQGARVCRPVGSGAVGLHAARGTGTRAPRTEPGTHPRGRGGAGRARDTTLQPVATADRDPAVRGYIRGRSRCLLSLVHRTVRAST